MKNRKLYSTLLGLAIGVSSVGILGVAYAQSPHPQTDDLKFNLEAKSDFFKPGHFMKKIDRKIEKIDKGIILTLTSEDDEVIKEIQTHPMPSKENDKVNVNQTNMANGVQLTITSEDAETVKKIQEKEEFLFKPFMMKFHKGPKGMENIQKKVEKIENGIIMTITSTDAKVVEQLQSKPDVLKQDEKVTVTHTKLENGIQITMTSQDAEVLKKLQNPPEHEQKFLKKHLKKKMLSTMKKVEN